ncbi:gliding motility-associated C-terminal domain-containing protein [Crocinitomicaceae bacterium]|nr:gliding motility-associated C-terminal domain-containing protein [Crocinitomicaceae bacterium]
MKKNILILSFITLGFLEHSNAQLCTITVTPSDTTICEGDSVLVQAVANLVNSGQIFDFNVGSLPPGWNTTGGTNFTEPCGPAPSGTPYYWASTSGTSVPLIGTAAFDISCGGVITFDMVYSLQGGGTPCEGPDLSEEGVELQYSTDGGLTWFPIEYYQPDGTTLPSNPGAGGPGVGTGQATTFTSWATYSVPIPVGALSATTEFRWYQANSSGTCCDNWGIDNVLINASGSPCGTTTVIDWGSSLIDSTSFYITPLSDTTLIADVYDTLGVYQCSSIPLNIFVIPNELSHDLVDTVYSFCPTTNPEAEVVNIQSFLPPLVFDWSTPSNTNPTSLPTNGSEQDTITYYVEMTDGCGFINIDSVVLIVNKIVNVDSLTSMPSSACEPTGIVMADYITYTDPSFSILPLYNWTGPGNPGVYNVNGTAMEDVSPGWYYFTVNDGFCSDMDSVFVEVLPPPIALLSVSTNGECSPMTVTFENTSENATYYEWDFGNGNLASESTLVSQTQSYTDTTVVTLTAYEFQGSICLDVTTALVFTVPCGCMDIEALNFDAEAIFEDGSCIYPEPIVIAPNIFTPNGDDANNFYELDVEFYSNIDLLIINRWGNEVFSGSGLNPKWNGILNNGEKAGEGTYFYKYNVIGINGEVSIDGHGFLQLVRN